MGKRLTSMDVTIAGVTRSYEWDPGIEVSSDDEGEASLEVLETAETTEVVLSGGTITSARVSVEYTYHATGTVSVDLDDLDEVESIDDLRSLVERGDFYVVQEAIDSDVSDEYNSDYATIDSVDVEEAWDEDGESIEE